MPAPPSPALNHLSTLTRLIEGWAPLNREALQAATALTNLVLSGAYPLAAARPRPGHRATLVCAVRERDAHRAAVSDLYNALQASLGAMLRWHGDLQDAASSLQGALDAAAERGRDGGGAVPPPALLAAERARDLLAELCADFGAEVALRSALARSLLPQSCGSGAAAAAAAAGAGGGGDECLAGGPGLSRDGESDREALTVALSAWAVPVHATAPRCARLLDALQFLASVQ